MGSLEGRVAIITGAGRGIGREHALFFAREGARVVVNDTGSGPDGRGDDASAAAEVVEEIRAFGGEAMGSEEDVTDWKSGEHLIRHTVESLGGLDILVNNAGILRDRSLVNMSEDDWDSVVDVHLKGHFVPLRHAAVYWRERHHAGEEVRASVVNTSSTSGLDGNPGQANYGSAKAGIAALTLIASQELARYGVRVNAIVPAARTRLTSATPGLDEMVRAPADERHFDEWDPANVPPLAAWLASADCDATGQMLYMFGGTVQPMSGWTRRPGVSRPDRWSVADLAESLPPVLG